MQPDPACLDRAMVALSVVVRKGCRVPNLAFPSGEPPVEGAVALSTWPWGCVSCLL